MTQSNEQITVANIEGVSEESLIVSGPKTVYLCPEHDALIAEASELLGYNPENTDESLAETYQKVEIFEESLIAGDEELLKNVQLRLRVAKTLKELGMQRVSYKEFETHKNMLDLEILQKHGSWVIKFFKSRESLSVILTVLSMSIFVLGPYVALVLAGREGWAWAWMVFGMIAGIRIIWQFAKYDTKWRAHYEEVQLSDLVSRVIPDHILNKMVQLAKLYPKQITFSVERPTSPFLTPHEVVEYSYYKMQVGGEDHYVRFD